MSVTKYIEPGEGRTVTEYRYAVAVRWIGDVGDAILLRHETDGIALARVAALLTKCPTAHVDEEHIIGIDHPIMVTYRVHLPKGTVLS